MHEYSIISALVDNVQAAMAPHPGAIVRRLHVQIGEQAGVEIELLRTAFETCRERSVCAGAELEIHAVAAAWSCVGCGRSIEPGAVLKCPACGRPARLVAGGEIILERIEMEVPDV
ncbi:MAG: hydrogenase maturation nickel metallochaperone HypA [Kofleriaceae bacterium]